MGGLLQALTFGYAGLRVHLDRLEIRKPQLPPGSSGFRIRGIKYLGANLTLSISQEQTTLAVDSTSDTWPLTFVGGGHNVTRLSPGITLTLTGEGPFVIRPSPWKDCRLPLDIIGNNYLRPIGT
ncbi:hypothetical protein JYU34_002140 [Plutella xylostella]|uniref:Glycoside hydrolase family 65 C-terminal domain-containing protein n=1 Tax=Plutella xylostella TaxID=51655 RepID=A0ABQ7R1G4_PLUXY|nr:hypothetical protein JYU34_002140 [Plutella xylostella]